MQTKHAVVAATLGCLGLCLFLPSAATADGKPSVETTLAAYKDALVQGKALSVLASRTSQGEGTPSPLKLPTPDSGRLSLLPPKQYKLEVFRADKLLETIVSDGVTEWSWNTKFKMKAVAPRALAYLSPDMEWAEKAYWPMTLFTSSALVANLVDLVADTQKAADGTVQTTLSGRTQATSTAVKMKVWFDASDHLPRRLFVDDGQVQATMNFALKTDPLDPSVFAARPPARFPLRKQEPEYPRVAHGTMAPAFSLKTPQGKQVSLSQYKGKVVLLEFWAPWCPTCLLASPFVNKLQVEGKSRGLEVLAVSTMAAAEELDAYLVAHPQDVTVLHDPADEEASVAYSKYKVSGLPSFVLLDRSGKVRRTWKYYLPGATESRLSAYTGELLDNASK